MRRLFVLALAAVAVESWAVATPAIAAPPPVKCGATLIHSARLTHDLHCASGNGVTLAAAVTLDLGGHSLVGSKTRDSNGGNFVGVLAINATGVSQVRNGKIQGWATGTGSAPFEGFPADFAVQHVRYSHNNVAVDGNGSHFAIDDSVVSFNRVGVVIAPTSGYGTASRTVFSDNVQAMSINYGGSMSLDRSRIERNQTGITCSETSIKVTNSVIRRNGIGISGSYGCGVTVTASRLDRNGVAISFEDFYGGVTLTKSLLTNNNIAFRGGANDTAIGNKFIGNKWAYRVDIRNPDLANYYQDLERNLFLRNGNAVYIASPDPDVRATIKIGHNTVLHNAGYGIYAPHATDLGGNVARGNGRYPQCTGVVCTHH